MALSSDGRALAEAAYRRSQLWRKYRYGGIGGFIGGMIPASSSILKSISDPHTPHREIAIYSGVLGLLFGAAVISAFFISRQRKWDEQLVRLFEKQYPDDCSWLQEEKILAEAEDIRLKAKVDFLIHKASR